MNNNDWYYIVLRYVNYFELAEPIPYFAAKEFIYCSRSKEEAEKILNGYNCCDRVWDKEGWTFSCCGWREWYKIKQEYINPMVLMEKGQTIEEYLKNEYPTNSIYKRANNA